MIVYYFIWIYKIISSYRSVTVNGWVLEMLGHLPQPGDTFDYNDLRVTVERVGQRRVERIRVTRKKGDPHG